MLRLADGGGIYLDQCSKYTEINESYMLDLKNVSQNKVRVAKAYATVMIDGVVTTYYK